MPKNSLLLIGIIIAVLVLIGISFGYGYKTGTEASQVSQTPSLEESKIIQSQYATARGEITEILNRTLTLTKDGDTLSIFLKEDAGLITFVSLEGKEGEEVIPEPQEIEFKDIKVGDKVVIRLELKANGEFEGTSITVLP